MSLHECSKDSKGTVPAQHVEQRKRGIWAKIHRYSLVSIGIYGWWEHAGLWPPRDGHLSTKRLALLELIVTEKRATTSSCCSHTGRVCRSSGIPNNWNGSYLHQVNLLSFSLMSFVLDGLGKKHENTCFIGEEFQYHSYHVGTSWRGVSCFLSPAPHNAFVSTKFIHRGLFHFVKQIKLSKHHRNTAPKYLVCFSTAHLDQAEPRAFCGGLLIRLSCPARFLMLRLQLVLISVCQCVPLDVLARMDWIICRLGMY